MNFNHLPLRFVAMKSKILSHFPFALALILTLISPIKMKACSMYKISVNGKTIVGCNEDAWRTTSTIWFENAKSTTKYGAGFTGSRQVGNGKIAPQSGMNTAGLTFSRLTSFYPSQPNPFTARKKIENEVDYLTDILHTCATIEEVKNYINAYDHSIFYDDVFIYIDASGKYLVVEPYQLIEGNEEYYVLSNFCPSITDHQTARKQERYRNGEDYIKKHGLASTLEYTTALSDTMHVCRSRNGDGTLLTSIWNTKDGVVNLYFYHDYDSTVQFNLSEELAKGDHKMSIPPLFPANVEFERLKSYKTPFNTPILRFGLVIIAGILLILALIFSFTYFRKSLIPETNRKLPFIALMNVFLIFYLFILATNRYIFYFDAPYEHYGSIAITASSYLPFLLLLIYLPFASFTYEKVKSKTLKPWLKSLLVSNNLIYLVLIFAFGYWGLFSFWN